MCERGSNGRGDGGEWASHPTADRLRAYLDEELPPAEADVIADHLETCERCTEAISDGEAVPIPSVPDPSPPPTFDERRMRRAVRRTLFGVATRAALLLVVGAIVVQAVGAFVVHPLLIDRGDRLPTAVAASIDLPVMTIPGAEVHEVLSNTGIRRRLIEVELERAVGADSARLGSLATHLGPLGLSTDMMITPHGLGLRGQPDTGSSVFFEPERLAEGAAVTVALQWSDDLIDLAAAGSLTADTEEVALLWLGFHVPVGETNGLEGEAESMVSRLGYSACAGIPDFLQDRSGGGFGTSGGFRDLPPPADGPRHALEQLRRATANLAGSGLLDDGAFRLGPLGDIDATAEWLERHDPEVTTVVVTGSLAAVTEVIEAAEPESSLLLEINLDRARPLPCG